MGRYAFHMAAHEYIDTERGEVLPHVTGMLEAGGWSDDRWYTAESCERGSAVHRLTADYDLGAVPDPQAITSAYKPYLLAHVKFMDVVRPTMHQVEEPLVHPVHRFGGRPDRVLTIYGALGVLDGKSGDYTKAHPIQTALQAILVAPELRLPPEALVRYCLYWQANGRFKLEEHKDRGDFRKAYELIQRYATWSHAA